MKRYAFIKDNTLAANLLFSDKEAAEFELDSLSKLSQWRSIVGSEVKEVRIEVVNQSVDQSEEKTA